MAGRLKRTKKNPARAGWSRRLALVRGASRAEVDVIGVQRCQIAWAIFPSLSLYWSARSLPLILIRWPINRSNRFSDFLRLDRLDRFGKIIRSIFSKFWKPEFQFSSDFQNFFGFLKFREKCLFCIFSKFPGDTSSGFVAYSRTSSDVERKVLGSKPTI